MADTNDGAQIVSEEKAQTAPLPSAEQKVPEGTAQSEVQDVNAETAGQTVPTGELPEDAKERTRREFEKLREQLRDERQQKMQLEDVFKTLSAPPAAMVQPPAPTPIYDPATGLLNEGVLNQTQVAALEAQHAAKAARAEAAQARAEVEGYKQELEARDTYKTYPELDPTGRSGKAFDKDLHAAARRIMTDSMFYPQDYGLDPRQAGRGLSFTEAATLAKRSSPVAVEEVKQEAAKEAIESLSPKEQASLGAQSVAQYTPEEEADLVRQTRIGGRQGDDALAARVARLRKQGNS